MAVVTPYAGYDRATVAHGLQRIVLKRLPAVPGAEKVHGFSHLEVMPNLLTLRHLNADGSALHSISKTPLGKISILA